jgi:prophage maintenance system killer protein
MPTGRKWVPVEDVVSPENLSDGELAALIEVWRDQSTALSESDAVETFGERLNREWAIETGIIERVYSIDRGTTQTLIEKGIEASLILREGSGRDPEEIAAILQDHLDALDGMFAFVKGEREISVGYIKELHSALLRHVRTHTVKDSLGNFFDVPLQKGAYKAQPNSPTRSDGTVHEYCPPEHVASEMDRLVEIHTKHVQAKLPAEVQAAWLHHAFTQIHPFEDGNGRVARTLASLVFVKAGAFPLVITRDDHVRYIEALEKADEGNIRPLVEMFVSAERRVSIRALQALPQPGTRTITNAPKTPDEAIAEIRDFLVLRGDALPKGWENADLLSSVILTDAHRRLARIDDKLKAELGQVSSNFVFSLTSAEGQGAKEASEAARSLGYELLPGATFRARYLHLEPGQSRIEFVLQRLGPTYKGIVAGLLLLVTPDGSAATTNDIFQINYMDHDVPLRPRFAKWLEAGLTRALEMWRAQI